MVTLFAWRAHYREWGAGPGKRCVVIKGHHGDPYGDRTFGYLVHGVGYISLHPGKIVLN